MDNKGISGMILDRFIMCDGDVQFYSWQGVYIIDESCEKLGMRINVSLDMEFRDDGIYISDDVINWKVKNIHRGLGTDMKDYAMTFYIDKKTIWTDDLHYSNGLYREISYKEWIIKGLME